MTLTKKGKKMAGKKAKQDIRIVVLQRGWVAVGRYSQDGQECRLDDARIVRVWGTTKGLPEIANDGPTEKTVLDGPTTLRFHELTTVMTLDCKAEKWATIFG